MGAISSLIKSGIKKLSKKSDKIAPRKAAGGKTKADSIPKSKPGSIRAAKEKKNKRVNEFKHFPSEGSDTARKVVAKGIEKQSKRTKTLERARKPGMSKGYKERAEWNKRLSNMKRQMAKQGHTKELAQKIGDLQQKIDNSYGKK